MNVCGDWVFVDDVGCDVNDERGGGVGVGDGVGDGERIRGVCV